MKNWLFLRGAWDERTQKSIDDDDDMWLQLFAELSGNNHTIFFKDKKRYYKEYKNYNIIRGNYVYDFGYNYIFSRGGFPWQSEICKKYPEAYKIRYGAGCRFMPEPEIDYNLILVDTEAQKQAVLSHCPEANVHLFIKPAARHFKPIDCEKEYDVCYIANGQQSRFKGVKWVYETVPKNLKVLHLGYPSEYKVPENVTQKRVDRIDINKEISCCKVAIFPYESTDSCPRALVECIACSLPFVAFDTLNFWKKKYLGKVGNEYKENYGKNGFVVKMEVFWKTVKGLIYSDYWNKDVVVSTPYEYYKKELSLEVAANYLKKLIEK